MDRTILIQLAYLIASVLFVVGIKMLGKTSTARQGNLYSAVAMLIAVVVTLLDRIIGLKTCSGFNKTGKASFY